VQQLFGGNHISSRAYRSKGIEPQVDLYREQLDANQNGVIDNFDVTQVGRNRGGGAVRIELSGDDEGPVIDADLVLSDGTVDEDGITGDTAATVQGTITDENPIQTITGQLDGGDVENLFDVIDPDFGLDGTFELTLAQIATIGGVSETDLIDSGPHTLTLTATDDLGNETAPSLEFVFEFDTEAPLIDAVLTPDTGRSDSDGITNDTAAKIEGSISDDYDIETFTAQVDGGDVVDLFAELGQDFNTSADFELDLAALASIAGLSSQDDLINDGQHTVVLVATNELGNESASLSVTFEIDTIAPDPPSVPDLVAGSDSGSSDTDNLTNDDTPTFEVDADTDVLVELFSDRVSGAIGDAIAASIVSITTSDLDDGDHEITATGTDVAGNTSSSAGLTVTIDTIDPTAPAFDLATASDTGVLGDHLTEEQFVTFSGTTEADASLSVLGSAVTAVAAGDGTFSLAGVELSFGAADYTIIATDAAGNTSQTTESFSWNSPPVVEDQTYDVDENAPADTVVATVAATDQNLGDGDSLTFAITDGNDAGVFAIDSANGEITVADPTGLDFETTTSFALTVQVTDAGGDGQGGAGLIDTATITVDVNDLDPSIDDQTLGPIDETAADDTVVGTVVVTGDDSVAYSITDDTSGGGFAIDGATGEISVADTSKINFEDATSYDVTVEVSDDGGATVDSAVVTINVNDVKPAIADQVVGSVSELAPDDTVVGTVIITGDDVPVTYTITNDPSGGGFRIDGSTGEITVDDSSLIDFETASSVDLTVQVSDDGGATVDDAVVTVDILNEAPVLDDQTLGTVDETAANGTSAGTVVISGDTSPVAFSITTDPTGGGFDMDVATGEITVADHTKLDFEASGGSYDVDVFVDDGQGGSASGTVTINRYVGGDGGHHGRHEFGDLFHHR
jgi:hypothetical protein